MFETWEELEKSIVGCQRCKLCKNITNIVFGTGKKQTDLMFIGEGPGADEDRLRGAFCGKSRKTYEHGI